MKQILYCSMAIFLLFSFVGCDDIIPPSELTLTIEVEGQGRVEPDSGAKFEVEATASLYVFPDEGWEFHRWAGNHGHQVTHVEENTYQLLMNRDKEVTAIFREKQTEAGDQISHSIEGITFNMRLAPSASFPIGVRNSGVATVEDFFWIGETQVTYMLWHTVRAWAQENGYFFVFSGKEGSEGETGAAPTARRFEPVTALTWYDSLAWCNALSELLGYEPVYTYNGEVFRNATKEEARAQVIKEETNGFRLPSSFEWELAARYKGNDSSYGAIEYPLGSSSYWAPGEHASGARADYSNDEATREAAWYSANTSKTQDVSQKPPGGNGLGLFDMSGNVWEWTFTLSGSERITRGGSWLNGADRMIVGYVHTTDPANAYSTVGLRVVRDAL